MNRADHPSPFLAPPPPGVVHVFFVSLDLPEDVLGDLLRVLSPEEAARADAFVRGADRRHFIAARAWLRRMLAGALGLDASALTFRYGPHGKPALAEAAGRLDFNLSHAGGHALLAVSPGFPIGADIEAVRPVEHKVAERFFSLAERDALAALPAAQWSGGFFRCWTRKEAYLKALGSGLATPLDGFSVSLGPRDAARLVTVDGDPAEAAAWTLAHLDFGRDLVGAVAARRRDWTLAWPAGAPPGRPDRDDGTPPL